MRSYYLYLNIPQTSGFLYFSLAVLNGAPSRELEETTRAPRITWLNTIQRDPRAYNLTLNEAVDLALEADVYV